MAYFEILITGTQCAKNEYQAIKEFDFRCCTKDEDMAPRNRLAKTGFKPPYAAVVKSYGSER